MKSLVRDIAEQITVAADSIDAIALRLGVRRDYLALLVRLSYWTAYMSPLWTCKSPSLTEDAISETRHKATSRLARVAAGRSLEALARSV
jgi:hypothetical protein